MLQVILPTDFSDNAWKAMCYAAQIYSKQPCKFLLVHTYNLPFTQMETGIIEDMQPVIEEVDKELDTLLKSFQELDHQSGSAFEKVVQFGSLVDNLDKIQADYSGKSIVVMGTKGASGANKFFLGSMTTSVLDALKTTPLICVPSEADLTPIKKIMLAADNLAIAKKTTLTALLDLAKLNDAGVKVVHVPEDELRFLEAGSAEQLLIHQYLTGLNHTFHIFEGSYTEDDLLQYAIDDQADLIAVVKRDRGFWKNLFHKSMTKSLAFRTHIPLLVMHEA
jgi:nucleotide-binding universal stress UspA family protein